MNNQIKKGLLLSMTVKKIKINKHLAKNTVVADKKVDCVVHFLRLLAVWWSRIKKGLLQNLPAIFFKLVNIWQSYV